ncbi:MAG TPA: hypothetical protein VEL76_02785 [Gemmataceae bacterium]|nr:hypothetical protein [Gemmataceae bacterium]
MRKITKADVEAYVLGCIHDPRLQKAIENARDSDSQVRSWFEAWDTEDSGGIQDIIAGQADALAGKLQAEHDAQEGRKKVIPLWTAGLLAAGRRGRLPEEMPICEAWSTSGPDPLSTRHASGLKSAAKSQPTAPEDAPLPEPPYTCVRDEVLLSAQQEEDIPFGLVRVLAMDEGKPFHSKIVMMTYDAAETLWRLELPLAHLFEGDIPDGKPDYYLVPADEPYAAWFPSAEVTRILKSLPASFTVERARLENLLEVLAAQ